MSKLLTKKKMRETHIGHVEFCSARKASNDNDYLKFTICTPDGEFTAVTFDELERTSIKFAYEKELLVQFHVCEKYRAETREAYTRFEGIRILKS